MARKILRLWTTTESPALLFETFEVTQKGAAMKRQIPYPHPGDILAEEFLKPMQITPYRLAKEIHVPLTRIAAILAGKRSVTVDTALRLSRFFGTSEGFWSGLQMDYDTAVAKDALSEELTAIATYNDERFVLAA